MRIAVVHQSPTIGGLTRFTKALVDGLAAQHETEIALFVLGELIEADSLEEHFAQPNVVLHAIEDPKVTVSPIQGTAKWTPPMREADKGPFWRLGSRLLRMSPASHKMATAAYGRLLSWRRRDVQWWWFTLQPLIIEELASYDVVYLAMPWFMDVFCPGVPTVGTFHDLNFLHFPENFRGSMLKRCINTMAGWARQVTIAVTSTEFIGSELKSFEPDTTCKSRVVYLAPYSVRPVDDSTRGRVLEKFDLTNRGFLLYPANMSSHKNVLGLVQALDLLKRQNGEVPPLVLTGGGTASIDMPNVAGYTGLVREWILGESTLELGKDVRVLGWVSDVEVDALTASAALVVSSSLYEAGCGPALDAWQYGSPVAMSNIPAFTEQLRALDVEALLFDPNDPGDIARVLGGALSDYGASLDMAERSKANIGRHTWQEVGARYLDVFREAMDIFGE